MSASPKPGQRPSVTAVIKFLKSAGFQHSRYTDAISSPTGFGFYVSAHGPNEVGVMHREGDHDFFKRMSALGITDVTEVPDDPEADTYAREYADALAPRYSVEVSGCHVRVTAHEQLPARPKGVPKGVTVRKALTDAGLKASTQLGHGWGISVVDQPDHTRIAVRDHDLLASVREALTAQGWIFTESENLQHDAIKITGSAAERPALLRKLRAARTAREIEMAGRAAVAKVEEGIRQTKAAQEQQGSTEYVHLVDDRDSKIRVLGPDDKWHQVPAHASEAEPETQESTEAPAAPPAGVYSAAGVRYAVGGRVTYRDRSGFWNHGNITKIASDESGAQRVHIDVDAYQVAPARRPIKHMSNTPGRVRPGRVREHPLIVALDDRDLTPSKEQ